MVKRGHKAAAPCDSDDLAQQLGLEPLPKGAAWGSREAQLQDLLEGARLKVEKGVKTHDVETEVLVEDEDATERQGTSDGLAEADTPGRHRAEDGPRAREARERRVKGEGGVHGDSVLP